MHDPSEFFLNHAAFNAHKQRERIEREQKKQTELLQRRAGASRTAPAPQVTDRAGPCVACNGIVSFEAATCPHCGQPAAGKKSREKSRSIERAERKQKKRKKHAEKQKRSAPRQKQKEFSPRQGRHFSYVVVNKEGDQIRETLEIGGADAAFAHTQKMGGTLIGMGCLRDGEYVIIRQHEGQWQWIDYIPSAWGGEGT